MAKYTTLLKSIVESNVQLFDFSYPIFDPLYKPVLEQKIVDRYYFREIGLETVGQFKHFLKMKLNEIMPYYNEQYLALEVFRTYDPYVNKDITVTDHRNTVQASSASGTGSGTSRDIFSDTPQGKLSGLDYATNLSDSTNDATSNSQGSLSSTDDYIQTIKGFDGMKYASDVYLGVKDTIVNLDVLILDELNVLFMNVY